MREVEEGLVLTGMCRGLSPTGARMLGMIDQRGTVGKDWTEDLEVVSRGFRGELWLVGTA